MQSVAFGPDVNILGFLQPIVSPSISSCEQVIISDETLAATENKTAKNSAAVQQQQTYAKDLMIAKNKTYKHTARYLVL